MTVFRPEQSDLLSAILFAALGLWFMWSMGSLRHAGNADVYGWRSWRAPT